MYTVSSFHCMYRYKEYSVAVYYVSVSIHTRYPPTKLAQSLQVPKPRLEQSGGKKPNWSQMLCVDKQSVVYLIAY